MEKILQVGKALANENRLRILLALIERKELCVCQIIAFLKMAPSTVSQHLSVLSRAGLVKARKEERWVYYYLPSEKEAPWIQDALKWLENSLKNSPQICEDRKILEKILAKTPEELCLERS